MGIDIKTAKANLAEKYANSIKTLSCCDGLEQFIFFVNDNTIFGVNATYDENMNILHQFAQKHGKYRMDGYYMNCSRVALQYTFEHFKLQLHCTDNEHALSIVGKGKCKIVTLTETTETIVCDIE